MFFHDTKTKFWKILSGKGSLWKIPIPLFAAAKCYLPQDPTPFNLLFSMLINDLVHFLFSSAHQPALVPSGSILRVTMRPRGLLPGVCGSASKETVQRNLCWQESLVCGQQRVPSSCGARESSSPIFLPPLGPMKLWSDAP